MTARVLVDGALSDPRLDHPEGVAVAADGSVWCGGERGQIYRVDPEAGTLEEVASTGGFCLGLAFDARGDLFVCDAEHGAVFRLSSGGLDRFADGFRNPNALAFDGQGRLYVSESHARGEPGPGLFRFAPDGTGGLWHDEPLHFANGLALAPDGSALYVAETWAHAIVRVAITADGEPGEREVVARLDGVLPDGLAFDALGRLYVACYEPSQILRLESDGAPTVIARDEHAHLLCHPTNVAFRGTELIAANLGRWHLTAIEVGTTGVPLPPR
jgi:sugar lactone lactonase YvrE